MILPLFSKTLSRKIIFCTYVSSVWNGLWKSVALSKKLLGNEYKEGNVRAYLEVFSAGAHSRFRRKKNRISVVPTNGLPWYGKRLVSPATFVLAHGRFQLLLEALLRLCPSTGRGRARNATAWKEFPLMKKLMKVE